MDTVVENRCSDGHDEITFKTVTYGGGTNGSFPTCPVCALQVKVQDLETKVMSLAEKMENALVDAAIAFFEDRKKDAEEYLEERVDKELRDVRRAAKIIVESHEVEAALEKMNSEKRDDDIPF